MSGEMIDRAVDEALRRSAEVRVPAHFANRVMAALPAEPVERPRRSWMLPALAIAGGAALGSVSWTAVALGWAQWLGQPMALASVLGIETVAALAWAWRVYRSAG